MFDSDADFLKLGALRPQAPLFVFLPGMDGWGTLFRRQLPGLQGYFDLRALRIPAADRSDWNRLSDRLIALILAELERRSNREVYLCGESFGGCLALQTAQKAPELISRLILVNPASSFHRRPWMGWGESIIPWIPHPIYPLSSLGIYLLLAALARIDPSDRQALWSAICAVPAETSAWRLSLLRTFAIAPHHLNTLTQPTLILASGADKLLPSPTEAQFLKQHLQDAQIVSLPHSGHACLLETSVNLGEILNHQKWISFSCVTTL